VQQFESDRCRVGEETTFSTMTSKDGRTRSADEDMMSGNAGIQNTNSASLILSTEYTSLRPSSHDDNQDSVKVDGSSSRSSAKNINIYSAAYVNDSGVYGESDDKSIRDHTPRKGCTWSYIYDEVV
jgi:hypothetical protein